MPTETVALAYDLGLRRFGENRAQELLSKAAVLPSDCEWHMIGAVQTNKVRSLAERVAVWHTLDRSALVAELARRAPGATVLCEVNVGGEAAKAGCAPDELDELVCEARAAGLDVRGLMCVPPVGDDPERHFAWLQAATHRLGLSELSMGMSGDLAAAVRCGATYVRIGTALFGPRRASDGARH